MTTQTQQLSDDVIRRIFDVIVKKAVDSATDTIMEVGKVIPDSLRSYYLLEVTTYLNRAAEVAIADIAGIDRSLLEKDPDLARDLTLFSNLLIRHYNFAISWQQAFEQTTLDFENTFGRKCDIGQLILHSNREIERKSR